MNKGIIFTIAILLITFLAAYVAYLLYKFRASRHFHDKDKEKRKLMPLSVLISSICVMGLVGLYGYHYVSWRYDNYLYHPFTVDISDDIFDLDFLDFYNQIMKKSGASDQLTFEDFQTFSFSFEENRIIHFDTKILIKKFNNLCVYSPSSKSNIIIEFESHAKATANEIKSIEMLPYMEVLSTVNLSVILGTESNISYMEYRLFYTENPTIEKGAQVYENGVHILKKDFLKEGKYIVINAKVYQNDKYILKNIFIDV